MMAADELKDVPIDLLVSACLQELAGAIYDGFVEVTGESIGFMLMVFPMEEGQRVNYISNCDRDEVKGAMETLLKHWAEGMPDIPAHKVN